MRPDVLDTLRRYWGFESLRALQAESIDATLRGMDSLTVLPTGGGKSLCYQLPPLVTGRATLVVSPLIALMQDQVAGLALAGVPAAAAHSQMTPEDRSAMIELAARGELRLVLVAPERLLMPDFLAWVRGLKVGHIAIDEAHCISQWGHDFRPEYRRLAEVRAALPGVPIGAYTATATPRVQEDIVEQLGLRQPRVMIGSFDRPNLTYRVRPRARALDQIAEVVSRHPHEASIVYCISRKDTEAIADGLKARGIDAAAYHAGLTAETRRRISEKFRTERLNVVVATVAFGMGIDRSDVRCVVHAALPKSVEAYQQETGRAGRDGLPAECVLLVSGSDGPRWRELMTRSASEASEQSGEAFSPEALRAQLNLLGHMQRLAAGARCRHRAISEYFGQAYEKESCGACDVCLGELKVLDDGHETARKIVSCVARLAQAGGSFGAGHVADILLGSGSEKVQRLGHQSLSTFGLLRGMGKPRVMAMIDQLVDAGDLERSEGEYPVLRLTEQSWEVMRNQRTAVLVAIETKPAARASERSAGEGPALAATERELFELLRAWRRRTAESLGVPPYVVFSDATLEELCRVRPGSPETLIGVRGIGQRKLADFGEAILAELRSGSEKLGLGLDAAEGSRRSAGGVSRPGPRRGSP